MMMIRRMRMTMRMKMMVMMTIRWRGRGRWRRWWRVLAMSQKGSTPEAGPAFATGKAAACHLDIGWGNTRGAAAAGWQVHFHPWCIDVLYVVIFEYGTVELLPDLRLIRLYDLRRWIWSELIVSRGYWTVSVAPWMSNRNRMVFSTHASAICWRPGSKRAGTATVSKFTRWRTMESLCYSKTFIDIEEVNESSAAQRTCSAPPVTLSLRIHVVL